MKIESMRPAALALALAFAAAPLHAQPTASAPGATVASPVKKELVRKVLQLLQGGVEGIARGVAERTVQQIAQAVGGPLQQVPSDRREAVGKSIDADLRKFVDEAAPVLRERALKLAPSTIGAGFEEKFSDDELRQLVAWLESPLNRKFQQTVPELQRDFMQKLIAEAGPLLDPKLQALHQKVRATLVAAVPAGAAASKPAK